MHAHGPHHRRCSACGDVIGVYEPCWIERADGTLHPTSLLNLDDNARDPAIRVLHVGCVIEDFPPPG